MRPLVEELLARHGFERILDVPAVPATNTQRIRFPEQVRAGRETWHLRSFGTDFSLVARGWLRAGMRRCYSLGWGRTDTGQSPNLLLAQAFLEMEEDADELGRAVADGLPTARYQWRVDPRWEFTCLRLAAVLDA